MRPFSHGVSIGVLVFYGWNVLVFLQSFAQGIRILNARLNVWLRIWFPSVLIIRCSYLCRADLCVFLLVCVVT